MKIIISVSIFLNLFLACNNQVVDKSETAAVTTQSNNVEIVAPENQDIASVDTTTSQFSNAPEFYNLELQGYGVPNINLKELYGEVIFLNHWGSWCGPCRMEMPSVQELYNLYGEKVKFVMIATEKRPGAHVPYIQKEGFTFPVYSMLSPVSSEIKPKGYPTTIILDKKGEIRTYEVGAANWNSENVQKYLDKLLAE